MTAYSVGLLRLNESTVDKVTCVFIYTHVWLWACTWANDYSVLSCPLCLALPMVLFYKTSTPQPELRHWKPLTSRVQFACFPCAQAYSVRKRRYALVHFVIVWGPIYSMVPISICPVALYNYIFTTLDPIFPSFLYCWKLLMHLSFLKSCHTKMSYKQENRNCNPRSQVLWLMPVISSFRQKNWKVKGILGLIFSAGHNI